MRSLNHKVSRELSSRKSTRLLARWISSNIYGRLVNIVVTSQEESWSSLHQSASTSSVRERFLPIVSTHPTSSLLTRSTIQIGTQCRERNCCRRIAGGSTSSNSTRCWRLRTTAKVYSVVLTQPDLIRVEVFYLSSILQGNHPYSVILHSVVHEE